MKKYAVLRIVLWSVAAAILITALVLGIVFKGITIPSFNIGVNGKSYKNEELYSIGNANITETINAMKVYWISGKITIEKYDGNEIQISETGANDEDNKLRYLVDDGCLTVQYAKPRFNIGIFTKNKKELTIKVPDNMADSFTDILIDSTSATIKVNDIAMNNTFKISSVSGEISCKNIKSDTLKINNVSGDAEFENLSTKKLSMNTVSGSLVVDGEITELDTDSTSGSVKVKTSCELIKCNTDSVSGDVNLTIPESTGFEVDYHTVSGDFNSDFAYINKGNKKINGNGEYKYDFDTTSGDVTINKI